MESTKPADYAYLRPITGIEAITIPALPGTRTISNDGGNIFSWIDPHFIEWDVNEPEGQTEALKVMLYEVIQDTSYEAFYTDTPQFWYTQDQILYICEHHHDKLRSGNFFRLKNTEKDGVERKWVVDVYRNEKEGLHIRLLDFSFTGTYWRGDAGDGVVLPMTTLI